MVVQVNANLSTSAPTQVTEVAYSTVTHTGPSNRHANLHRSHAADQQRTRTPQPLAAVAIAIVIIAAVAFFVMKRGKAGKTVIRDRLMNTSKVPVTPWGGVLGGSPEAACGSILTFKRGLSNLA